MYTHIFNKRPDATGEPWEYLDGRAVRNPGILEPKPVFDITEWTIGTNIDDIDVYDPFSYDQGSSPCTEDVRGRGKVDEEHQGRCHESVDRTCDPSRYLLHLPAPLSLPAHL